VIAVSDHVAGLHAQVFGTVPVHVLRIPAAPLARRVLPPRTPPRTIGYLGALASTKGIGRLLEAAPELQRLGLTVRIAGTGAYLGEVEQAAAAGIVEYAGVVRGEDKLRFIESCDLAILPSLWNEPGGPPCSVAEWLSGGRPVLVSPRGGLAEVAAQRSCVLAVEPTAAGIVAAARDLLEAGRFEQLLAGVPAGDDPREARAWLEAHREVYESAAER
jgi:glycosyltransferase involved in cell wall biosynthesis